MGMTDEEVLQDEKLSKEQKFKILLTNNLGLIRKEAKRFKNSNDVCDELDYEQEAAMAIFENVIENYRPEMGVKFSTYLTYCVRNAMRKHASLFYGPFTIANKTRVLIYKLKEMISQGIPMVEIKKTLKLKNEQFKNLLFLAKLSKVDTGIEEFFVEVPLGILVSDANLTDQEVKVIELRQTKTLKEVGDELGCSYEWVRKLEKNAIQKVKSVL